MKRVFRIRFLLLLISLFISCSSVNKEEKTTINKGEAVAIENDEMTIDQLKDNLYKQALENQKQREYEKRIRNAPEGSPDARYNEIKTINIDSYENAYEVNSINKFTELEEIVFTSFRDFKIPESVFMLKKLKKISFKYLSFASPEEFYKINQIQELEELHLFKVKNINFSFDMGKMVNLKKITMDQIILNAFPYGITKLPNILEISIQRAKIQTIDSNISNLKSLKYLDLSNNIIQSIPESMGELSNLEELHMNSNRIQKLPSSIRYMKKMVFLSLNNNELVSLGVDVGEMEMLSVIKANGNTNLLSLDFRFEKLKQLDTIEVSRCHVSSIPSDIGFAVNLRRVILAKNKIEKIPQSFGKLEKLEYLDLSSNLIGNNDISMLGKLKKLETLLIAYNNIPNDTYFSVVEQLPNIKKKIRSN